MKTGNPTLLRRSAARRRESEIRPCSAEALREGENPKPSAGRRTRNPGAVTGTKPTFPIQISNFEFRRAAFSLIEILVVVALLSIIVLGLLAMFSQTQRAFNAGNTQADILAAGRLTSDQLIRELEQITPAYQSRSDFLAPNFYAEIVRTKSSSTNLTQALPGGNVERTNVLHDLFFVTRVNQTWFGIGYFVRLHNPQTGALLHSPLRFGDLYRFETNTASGLTVYDLFDQFRQARQNEYLVVNGKTVNQATKLAEGVVHFKVRVFDTNGAVMLSVTNRTNLRAIPDIAPGEAGYCAFQSNALPAAVEVELGILEDKTWQRLKGLPSGGLPPAQEKFLKNQAGRVHLFRERVALHNLDPIAYQ